MQRPRPGVFYIAQQHYGSLQTPHDGQRVKARNQHFLRNADAHQVA